jgi:G3E family GTPase
VTEPLPAFTPVTLLTGFLGSGKTTLLRRLLADPALADTAVLINEFGEVGLDHHLLERIDGQTVLLQSGCLCCTIRGELAEALRDLLSRRARGAIPPFRRVVIESTGLADPFPVLSTLAADPVLRHHVRAGNVVTTVDAALGAATFAAHPESVKQVAVADRIVMTKTDLVDATTSAAAEAAVRAINPAAALLRAGEDLPSAETLLGQDARDLSRHAEAASAWVGAEATEAHGHHHRDDHDHDHDRNRHGPGIRAFALTFEAPLDWTAFGVWLTLLLHRHGARVLRVKGILAVAGSAAPVAVHGVQHLVHPPVHMAAWPDADRRSRLVFIVDGLDPQAIKASLATFAALGERAPGPDGRGKKAHSALAS